MHELIHVTICMYVCMHVCMYVCVCVEREGERRVFFFFFFSKGLSWYVSAFEFWAWSFSGPALACWLRCVFSTVHK